jgi:HEAT repeat protein
MPLIRKGPSESKAAAGPNVSSSLASVLQNGASEDRWAASRSATEVDIQILGQALFSERDARVREAIFTSLARFRNAASVEAVLPHLRSDDANLRTGALDALRTMPQAVGPKLQSLLSDADSDVRLLACEIVRELFDARASRLLCDLLDTEREANVCSAAVEVLAEIGDPEAIPILQRCAERFSDVPFLAFSIREACARLLAKSPSRRD